MAFYRLEAKIIGREKRGRSVVAASAYRSGGKIKDERKDRTYDYRRRSKGVVDSVVIGPDNMPEWAASPATLWNRVEAGEKRRDAQLAREFILSVPQEISDEEQFAVAVGWAKKELVSKGMIVEISLHHSKSGKNPHVHILATMRPLDADQFSKKKERDWNDVALLRDQRESWGRAVNEALKKAGRPERVDHRSLKDQGIDRIPEPKIGVAANAMKKRGLVFDPEQFQLVRYIRTLNEVRPWLKAVEKFGEVYQEGLGKTWWERSLLLMSATKEAVRTSVMDTWDVLVKARERGGFELPSRDEKGPDHER